MPKRRGLFIGVNTYAEDSGLAPLDWAEADAEKMRDAFRDQFDFDDTVLLVGKEATFTRIQEELIRAGQDNEGDLFTFFFAGHGMVDGTAYMLYPGDSSHNGVNALPFSTCTNIWQKNFPYQKVLVLLDACRSQFVPHGARAGQPGQVRCDAATINILDSSVKGARNIDPHSQRTMMLDVIHSCDNGYCSWEFGELGHGLFTYGILEALKRLKGKITPALLVGDAADVMRAKAGSLGADRQQPYRSAPASLQNEIVLREGADDYIECPLCHGKNASKQETFRCPACGRDNLCLSHRSPRHICTDCEAKQMTSCAICSSWHPQQSSAVFTCPECGRSDLCRSHRVQISPEKSICNQCAADYVACPECNTLNHPDRAELFTCPECGRNNLCLSHRNEETGLCPVCSAPKKKSKLLVTTLALMAGGGLVFALQQRTGLESLSTYSAELMQKKCPANFPAWLAGLRSRISAGDITATDGAIATLFSSYRQGCNSAAVEVKGIAPKGGTAAAPFWFVPVEIEKSGGLFYDPQTGRQLSTADAWSGRVLGQLQRRDRAVCATPAPVLFPMLQRLVAAGSLTTNLDGVARLYSTTCGDAVGYWSRLDPTWSGTPHAVFFYGDTSGGSFVDATSGKTLTSGSDFLKGVASAVQQGNICASSYADLKSALTLQLKQPYAKGGKDLQSHLKGWYKHHCKER